MKLSARQKQYLRSEAHHLKPVVLLGQHGLTDAVLAEIDEALRVRGPLIANRRVATRDVELAGQPVRAGDRVRVLWPSANRDERVFEAPEEIRLDRSPHDDLFFGAGSTSARARRRLAWSFAFWSRSCWHARVPFRCD